MTPERAAEGGATAVSKEELLRQSDVLTIHMVLSPKTRGLLGADDLALMKTSSLLVNTSRGPLIDEVALVNGAHLAQASRWPRSTCSTSNRCPPTTRCVRWRTCWARRTSATWPTTCTARSTATRSRRSTPGSRSARSPPDARRRRKAGIALGVLAALAATVTLTLAGCQSFGEHASGERLARMEQLARVARRPLREPAGHVERHARRAAARASAAAPTSNRSRRCRSCAPIRRPWPSRPPSGLRVTWFGHSSTLLEVDGTRVLTDPIWSERASPVAWAGPHRWYPPTIALAQLPPVDAVLISHDHYDHLDMPTIVAMRSWKNVFIVPLGIGAHLARWGIPAERIVELDWWQSTRVGALTVTLVPARHASGRVNAARRPDACGAASRWSARSHRVYYSGDTGLFDAMTEIGQRFGPFDLAMIEAGQYDADWPDWHLGPEQIGAGRSARAREER